MGLNSEDKILIILLGISLVLLLFFLFVVPSQKDNVIEEEIMNPVTGLTINNEPDVTQLVAGNSHEACKQMCLRRDSISYEIKNVEGVLHCVCANGYNIILDVAE